MMSDETPQDRGAGGELGVILPGRKRPGRVTPRHVLFAGVAGACVLGAGLGLWARPAMNERRVAAAAPEPDPPAAVEAGPRKLRIVVDDRPAAVAAPAETPPDAAAPTGPVATPLAAAFATPAPPQAASPAPAPVVRVETPLPPLPAAVPPAARPAALPRLTPLMIEALAEVRSVQARLSRPIPPLVRLPSAPPVRVAEVEPPPAPKAAPTPTPAARPAHAVQVAQAPDRAAAAKAGAAARRVELAKAAAAEKAQRAEIQKARFEKTKADRLEKARLAKAEHDEAIKLAKAEARGRAEAKAEARAEALAEAREEARKQIRLASLARAVRQVLPHPAKPAAPVEVARIDRKHARKAGRQPAVEPASLKTRRAPHAAESASRGHPAAIAPQPHASGLMKVSAPRCASRDPGEALVCADPSLGAADRQLARAYQGARAAGVPEVQLQRQQQRWLAARSAAAREAPWAVHDVYLARIAELNSQARDAHGDGY